MRYHVVYSTDQTGSYTEFSAGDDAAAWEHAERGAYGARIVYLAETRIRAGGDERRVLKRPANPDPDGWLQAGYDTARRNHGDSYADYLIRHDQELRDKGRTIRPWPLSLQGNDGD